MPNHVHALVQLKNEVTLQKLMRTWKGISSRNIGQIINRPPPLWQEGYWDRMIRNEAHYLRCRKYIRNNPEKAGLNANEFIYLPG